MLGLKFEFWQIYIQNYLHFHLKTWNSLVGDTRNHKFWIGIFEIQLIYFVFPSAFCSVSEAFDRYKSDRKSKSIQLHIFIKNCQNHFQILFFYLFWVASDFWYIYQSKFEIKVWNQKMYLAAMSEYFALKIGSQFIEMFRLLKVVRHRGGICAEL